MMHGDSQSVLYGAAFLPEMEAVCNIAYRHLIFTDLTTIGKDTTSPLRGVRISG